MMLHCVAGLSGNNKIIIQLQFLAYFAAFERYHYDYYYCNSDFCVGDALHTRLANYMNIMHRECNDAT